MAPSQSKPIDKSMYAKKSPTKNSSKLSKRPRFSLTVWGFPPLCIEAYAYRKGTDRDGYGNHYRKCVDGDEECKELDDAGFSQYFTRRISKLQNVPLVGADEWACFIYVRWVPGMNPSTAQTREEGLSFFRKYLMDPRYSRYPPNDILTMDLTNVNEPLGMDNFFLDEHILLFIKDLFQPSIANEDFFRDHNNIAKLFFSSAPYPPEAPFLYGFGNPDVAGLNNNNAQAAINDSAGQNDETEGQEDKEKSTGTGSNDKIEDGDKKKAAVEGKLADGFDTSTDKNQNNESTETDSTKVMDPDEDKIKKRKNEEIAVANIDGASMEETDPDKEKTEEDNDNPKKKHTKGNKTKKKNN